MSTFSPDAATGEAAVAPKALESSAVLARRPSPHVDWVEVEGEVVVWNAEAEALHLLDPIAALVFQLLDGATPLEQTAGDLAEVFGRDIDLVRADVLRFAASLEDIGIAERVQ